MLVPDIAWIDAIKTLFKIGRYMNDALIVSAARLPIGKFGGALKEVSDWDLGAIAMAEAIKRAGLKGDEIDEVIMAHGFRAGDLPANSLRPIALICRLFGMWYLHDRLYLWFRQMEISP